MRDFLNYSEVRGLAKRQLPHGLFEYIDRGTEDENGLRRNRHAFDSVRIRPRVLTGSGGPRTQSVSIFGHTCDIPIVVAPTAMAGLVWYQGEIELAKAAAASGIPFCAAMQAISSVEEITAASPGQVWFQLYFFGENEQFSEELARDLSQRAWNNGVRTLVVTVDMPVPGNREYRIRNGFEMPIRYSARNLYDVAAHPRWTVGVFARYLAAGRVPAFANYPIDHRCSILSRKKPLGLMPGLSWDHIRRLRDTWKGNFVVKGILRPDDAILAAKMGADGIVVSDHGGRRFDSAVAPIQVLAEIVDEVGQQLTVIVDSGIRRGSDILKFLAMGAKAVMIGRGLLYGTAVGGMSGANRMIEILRRELDTAMAMTGCIHIRDLNRDYLEISRSWGGHDRRGDLR
ncbi:(S)-mandelate dehydrogenase [Bradyrhizobium sp. GM7.3]